MRLEIKDVHSADVDSPRTWKPSSVEQVYFQLQIEIGVKGEEGGHLFQLVVATPEGLRETIRKYKGYEFPDRALMIVSDYKWSTVQKRLGSILAKCTRETWNESLECLQRYFLWEYEEYRVSDR